MDQEPTLTQKRLAVFGAWHSAMFDRQKQLPSLQEYMPRVHTDEQAEEVDQIRAMLSSVAVIVREGGS